jgi:3-oxoacyl-[acyl-carrier protein] reductase
VTTQRLGGRVFIVTGGAQGLGRSYVRRLVGSGARAAVVDIDGQRSQELAASLGPSATAVATDVTDESSVAAMVETVLERWGRIDGLVNNAGGSMYKTEPFDTVPRAQWDHVLAVNLTGQFLCAAAVAPTMRAANYGKIVNICSSTVFRGVPLGMTPYIAAKGGVVGLTRALSHELGPHNICVNAIAPGYVQVETPKAVHTSAAAASLAARMSEDQAIHREQTPEDLGGTLEFLCSSESDFVTGQVFSVDGGWTHN